MLAKLCVKNFAIIEDIDIDFKDGLTVLTGETGAGKSLIIDSISLLLGERASLEMIRNGVDKAEIKGIFISHNKRLLSALNKLDIDILNDEIIISRTISPNKSVIKVNDKVITLSDLKNISKYLADIHQQLDMVKLLNKDNYLEMIDGFKYELISEYQTRYLDSLEELKNRYNSYQSLLKRIEDIKKEKDSYTYSLKELEAAHLDENEEEEINSRIELLTNYDKIYALLEENKELMDKDSLDDIYKIKENVNKLSTYQNEYQKMYESLSDHYYEIEAIYDDLKHIFNNLDYDPNELTELETRKNDLNLLKKKYHQNLLYLLLHYLLNF